MGLFDFLRKKSVPAIQTITSRDSLSPISILKKQISGIGHPEYPFLSQRYSPSSRVPCTDFTGFIVGRIIERDEESIKKLMRGIIEGNPGLGTGLEWIDRVVQEMLDIPVEKFVSFSQKKALFELKALWILTGKNGGARRYWIADNDKSSLILAIALCAYCIGLKPDIDLLIRKGNEVIKELAKDTPYWKDYPRFNKSMLQFSEPGESECRRKICGLSVGARIHLFQALSIGNGKACSLPDCTDYPTRNMGLHIPHTTREILESQLLLPTDNINGLSSIFRQQDLVALCQEKGASFRKSWNKEKLISVLADKAPDFVKAALKERCVVEPNPTYANDLGLIFARAGQLENLFKVLCFA